MNSKKVKRVYAAKYSKCDSGLLDGLTGAGLFRRLRYLGAPVYAVDPRSAAQILDETSWLNNHSLRSAVNERVMKVK